VNNKDLSNKGIVSIPAYVRETYQRVTPQWDRLTKAQRKAVCKTNFPMNYILCSTIFDTYITKTWDELPNSDAKTTIQHFFDEQIETRHTCLQCKFWGKWFESGLFQCNNSTRKAKWDTKMICPGYIFKEMKV
jgi:hypothetical protein